MSSSSEERALVESYVLAAGAEQQGRYHLDPTELARLLGATLRAGAPGRRSGPARPASLSSRRYKRRSLAVRRATAKTIRSARPRTS